MKNKLIYIGIIALPLTSCGIKPEIHVLINYSIVTVQPMYSQLIMKDSDEIIGYPTDAKNEAELIPAGCKNLANSLANVTYSVSDFYFDKPLNKDIISNFNKNQYIVLQSHGDYDTEHHSFIVTNDILDTGSEDYQNGLTCEYMGWPNEGITSKYIDAYCPDISGSIVYLGQCFSGKDDVLAKSFLNKGAVAVLASSCDIQMHYGDMMQYKISTLLGEINPKTNNYYTLKEALEEAQNLYGKTDKEKYQAYSNDCEVLLFGDGNIRLAENM